MEKIIYSAAVIIFTAFTLLTSCETPGQQQNAQSEEKQLNETKAILPEEYPIFKTNADSIINANEKKIADMRIRMGEFPADTFSALKLDTLQSKNHELKDRLYGYEKVRSEWGSFKNKFKQDMDSVDVALNNFRKRP